MPPYEKLWELLSNAWNEIPKTCKLALLGLTCGFVVAVYSLHREAARLTEDNKRLIDYAMSVEKDRVAELQAANEQLKKMLNN